MRVLLLGGSKSGKSLLAQSVCRRLAGDGKMLYWATMEPTDDEDRARIARHLQERDGWGFETVERGRHIAESTVPADATVLFDSVTALLANEMFSPDWEPGAENRCAAELLELSRRVRNFICVCDDIWRDGAAYSATTEQYRRGLAAVCRRLAAEFDVVCEVAAGLPHYWKGTR